MLMTFFVGHEGPTVVTDLLRWLANRYDTADKKLNITGGNRHDYLEMTIDFSNKAAVAFNMIPYISKTFTAFPEKITGAHSTPAADYLFNVCPLSEAKLLPEEQAHAFWILRHNYFFFLVFNVTYKLLLHS